MLHCNDTICSPEENRVCVCELIAMCKYHIMEGRTGLWVSPTVRINAGAYHARLKLRKERE